jgi:hypothetical protein
MMNDEGGMLNEGVALLRPSAQYLSPADYADERR